MSYIIIIIIIIIIIVHNCEALTLYNIILKIPNSGLESWVKICTH